MPFGARMAQARASSMFLTSQIEKPATTSRASAKGPSITVRLAPSLTIRLPSGLSPAAATITPASTSSSMNLSIAPQASSISGLGSSAGALLSVSEKTMTRIVCLLVRVRLAGGSNGTTNEASRIRQRRANFFASLSRAGQGLLGRLDLPARGGRAVHLAAVAVVVVRTEVHRPAVVPQRDHARLPAQAAGEGVLGHVLDQEVDDRLGFESGHALDPS